MVVAHPEGAPDPTDTLLSLKRQTHRDLEIVLVGPDHPIRPPGPGLGATRNAGAAAATGRHLTFVDAGDTLPPDAVADLVRSLRRSGSDVAVGAFRSLTAGGARRTPPWVGDVHRRERRHVTLTEDPGLLRRRPAWGALFDRAFFLRAVGAFPVDVRDPDLGALPIAYARGRVDVLTRTVYDHRLPPDDAAAAERRTDPADLAARLAHHAETRELLAREADATVVRAWTAEALGADLRSAYEQVPRTGAEFWRTLRTGLARLAADADAETWRLVPLVDRYPALCVRDDHRDDLIAWLTRRDTYGTTYPTVVVDGHVRLDPAYLDGLAPHADPAGLELADEDLRLVSRLFGWDLAGDRLRLRGYAYVTNLNRERGLEIEAALVAGDRRTPLAIDRDDVVDHLEDRVDVDARDPWSSHRGATFTGEIDLAPLRPGPDADAPRWRVELTVRAGPVVRTGGFATRDTTGSAAVAPIGAGESTGRWVVGWSRAAGVQVRHETGSVPPPDAPAPTLAIDAVALVTGALRLTGRCAGPVPSAAHLVGPRGEVATTVGGTPEACTVEVDLTAAGPLDRRAPYELRVETAAGPDLAAPSARLLADLAQDQRTATHALTVSRGPEATLRLKFRPPYGPEERSRRAAHRLQQTFRRPAELRDAVLFESYTGKTVTDSPRAICAELLRRGTDLEVFCTVDDLARGVPEGATPVLWGSRAWTEAAHTSRWLVNNMNFAFFFRKQPGQTYVQTWHGTPLKRIGDDVPSTSLSLPYRDLMTREPGSWDLLLAQNPFAAEVLPRAFGYAGDVVTLGYPRNDLLATAGPEVRERVRTALGLGPETLAVLYAPTWRDTTKGERGYAFVRHLDPDVVHAGLGPSATVLLRGHANITNDHRATAGVVDVTAYPEIDELYLAADVLVTDYSSVLFDFCVTGKPMVFLAPDLAEYRDQTRGFYLDYEDAVPGPVYATTDDVVAALADLPGLQARFAERYAAFRATYAPLDDGRAAARVVDRVWGAS